MSLHTALTQEGIHIATVAETKLQGPPPRIDACYSWFTRNRKKNQGGGVAVVAYVRNDLILKVRTIDKVENENIEILWVEIKTGKNNKT